MLSLNLVSVFAVLTVNWFPAVGARSRERISACGPVVTSECWCLVEDPCESHHNSKSDDDIPIVDEGHVLTAEVIQDFMNPRGYHMRWKTSKDPNALDIPRRKFEAIDRKAFDNSTHLTSINLDRNNIVRLPPFVFSKLENLTDLTLSFNGLTKTKRAFAGLGKLKTLTLSGNPLTKALDHDCFYGVPKSADIWIQGAENVRKIGTNAFGSESSTSVRKLDDKTRDDKKPKAKSVEKRSAFWPGMDYQICINDGTLLLLDFIGAESMEKDCQPLKIAGPVGLDITDYNITKFAKGWYRMLDKRKVSSVSSIDLSDNKIARVTSEVVNDLPTYITWLTLKENKIERLEKGTFVHSSIFSLELQDNLITEIEDDTFKMPKLYQLNLQNNRLKNTKFMATMPSALSSLDLTNNEIEEISPNSISPLKNLHYLNLDHNRIKTMHSQSLHGVGSLGALILSNNGLVTIEPGVFEGVDLGGLSLGGNNLTSLKKGVFAGIKDLQSLDLPNNNIKEMSAETFDIPNLESLDLRNNHISVIEKGAVKNLGTLKTLDISNNPINKLENGVLFGLNKNRGTYVLVSKKQIELIQGGVFDDV